MHLTTRADGRGASSWRTHAARAEVASPSPSRAFGTPSHLWVELLHTANAPRLAHGDDVQIHYACLLGSSASCMDSSRSKPCSSREPLRFQIGAGQVVPGMEYGAGQLGLGDVARIHVPAQLGYGKLAAGPIPPGSDLVFEVEVVGVNGRRTASLPTSVLRALLMLPCIGERPPSESPVMHPDAARTESIAMASVGLGVYNSELDVQQLPAWLTRLRGHGPIRPSENELFDKFYDDKLGGGRAVEMAADLPDFGASLIPGVMSITHAPYATPWDAKAPVVLTGNRPQWTPNGWDWQWFEQRYGDDLVLCKQRAPIFEDDRSDDTLIAECTLREYMQ